MYINSLYYKLVTDINFINEVIKTGEHDIIFKSDNLEYGVEENDGNIIGKNLRGLAIMEIKDQLRRVYENYEDIDWNLSGGAYSKQRCACMMY